MDEEIIPKVSDNVYNPADTLEDGFVTDEESNDSLFPDKLECEIFSKVSRRNSLDLDDLFVSGMPEDVFETNPSSPDPFETRITPIVGFIESLNAANSVDNNNSNLDDNEEKSYMLNKNTSLSTADNLNTNTITGQTRLENVAILSPSPISSACDNGGNSKSRVSVSTNGIVLFLKKKTPRENGADSSLLPLSLIHI